MLTIQIRLIDHCDQVALSSNVPLMLRHPHHPPPHLDLHLHHHHRYQLYVATSPYCDASDEHHAYIVKNHCRLIHYHHHWKYHHSRSPRANHLRYHFHSDHHRRHHRHHHHRFHWFPKNHHRASQGILRHHCRWYSHYRDKNDHPWLLGNYEPARQQDGMH